MLAKLPLHALGIEIVGFVPRLPFDVATNARHLWIFNRLACQHRVDSGSKVFPGERAIGFRTAIIQLTAINEFSLGIEQEEIGSASSAILLRDLL